MQLGTVASDTSRTLVFTLFWRFVRLRFEDLRHCVPSSTHPRQSSGGGSGSASASGSGSSSSRSSPSSRSSSSRRPCHRHICSRVLGPFLGAEGEAVLLTLRAAADRKDMLSGRAPLGRFQRWRRQLGAVVQRGIARCHVYLGSIRMSGVMMDSEVVGYESIIYRSRPARSAHLQRGISYASRRPVPWARQVPLEGAHLDLS